MPKDKTEVLVGVGMLYTAAVGTVFPTHFAAPAPAWDSVGYTEDGVSLEYTRDMAEIMVDQELDPVKVLEQSRNLQVSTTLAQVSAKNLQRAFGGGVVTAVDPDATPNTGDEYDKYTPPAVGAGVNTALLFDGVDEVAAKARLLVQDARAIGTSTVQFQKADNATIAAVWRVLKPVAGDTFELRVRKQT